MRQTLKFGLVTLASVGLVLAVLAIGFTVLSPHPGEAFLPGSPKPPAEVTVSD